MTEIRIVKEEDASVLSQLAITSYVESHGHFINNEHDLAIYIEENLSIPATKEQIANPSHLFYILYADEIPAGYVKLFLNLPNKNIVSQNVCQLERIYVLADFIPLKVGQKLMEFAQAKAKELKFDALWLNVYIKNIRAVKFYEKNDFLRIGKYDYPVNDKVYENIVFSKNLK